jgi:hypothetical protein
MGMTFSTRAQRSLRLHAKRNGSYAIVTLLGGALFTSAAFASPSPPFATQICREAPPEVVTPLEERLLRTALGAEASKRIDPTTSATGCLQPLGTLEFEGRLALLVAERTKDSFCRACPVLVSLMLFEAAAQGPRFLGAAIRFHEANGDSVGGKLVSADFGRFGIGFGFLVGYMQQGFESESLTLYRLDQRMVGAVFHGSIGWSDVNMVGREGRPSDVKGRWRVAQTGDGAPELQITYQGREKGRRLSQTTVAFRMDEEGFRQVRGRAPADAQFDLKTESRVAIVPLAATPAAARAAEAAPSQPGAPPLSAQPSAGWTIPETRADAAPALGGAALVAESRLSQDNALLRQSPGQARSDAPRAPVPSAGTEPVVAQPDAPQTRQPVFAPAPGSLPAAPEPTATPAIVAEVAATPSFDRLLAGFERCVFSPLLERLADAADVRVSRILPRDIVAGRRSNNMPDDAVPGVTLANTRLMNRSEVSRGRADHLRIFVPSSGRWRGLPVIGLEFAHGIENGISVSTVIVGSSVGNARQALRGTPLGRGGAVSREENAPTASIIADTAGARLTCDRST